jgi:hypothetical protein
VLTIFRGFVPKFTSGVQKAVNIGLAAFGWKLLYDYIGFPSKKQKLESVELFQELRSKKIEKPSAVLDITDLIFYTLKYNTLSGETIL